VLVLLFVYKDTDLRFLSFRTRGYRTFEDKNTASSAEESSKEEKADDVDDGDADDTYEKTPNIESDVDAQDSNAEIKQEREDREESNK
jgi:hypothetical protein